MQELDAESKAIARVRAHKVRMVVPIVYQNKKDATVTSSELITAGSTKKDESLLTREQKQESEQHDNEVFARILHEIENPIPAPKSAFTRKLENGVCPAEVLWNMLRFRKRHPVFLEHWAGNFFSTFTNEYLQRAKIWVCFDSADGRDKFILRFYKISDDGESCSAVLLGGGMAYTIGGIVKLLLDVQNLNSISEEQLRLALQSIAKDFLHFMKSNFVWKCNLKCPLVEFLPK